MASKVVLEKCNDLDLPIDTSKEIYRLNTGTSKENHYLVIPKDCNIYLQMHENQKNIIQNHKKSQWTTCS